MKLLITLFTLTLTMSAQAQTKDSIDTAQFAAIYDYTVRTQDDEGKDVCDSIQVAVQVGQRVTKSMPRSHYQAGEDKDAGITEYRKLMEVQHRETLTHMPTVWTNHPEGETTVREMVFPREFEGHEPTPSLDWTLTDDTLTINGYLCSRAEVTFRGIRWTAWYTQEVPSSVGPWRLRGLPGIIVKATGNAHTFTLTELRDETSAITYATNIKIERMKYPKLLKYRNQVFGSKQYPKNPHHHLPTNTDMGIEQVTAIKNESGDGGYILVNGGFHMLQKAHVHQPLEKE
ncbi:MAG: GLPGLI family protein [Bacteroidaceae bacterium]|nr:GLPGLI family protein [Bacteroidaceae bacterium]